MTTADAPEAKKNHLWRRTIWQTDPDQHPLGPRHSAEVYCCEESNGFAVWYVRKLPHGERRGTGTHGIDNGDYLLAYYSRDRRDDAIMRAVHVATGAETPELQISELDDLARHGQKL